jgi:hypothetical protein
MLECNEVWRLEPGISERYTNESDVFCTGSARSTPVSALLEPREHVGGVAPQHRVVELQASYSDELAGHRDTNGAVISGRTGTWNMGPV